MIPFWLLMQLLFALLLPAAPAEPAGAGAIQEHVSTPWTGDLDGMVERGFVRILTVHNPILFTFDGRRHRGLADYMAGLFQKHLDGQVGKVRSPTVVLVPVARDALLSGLVEGRGDIAVANLTITPERGRIVDFSVPMNPDVRELVVTGPAAPSIRSFDDLARTGLHLRPSSSYAEHVDDLNARRRDEGKEPIPIHPIDEYLEDYDLLDMVKAGILPAIVVDSHKLAFWKPVFRGIRVHEDLVLHADGRIAWAFRKNSPQLKASVDAFVGTVKKGTLLGNIALKRYLSDAEWIENALSSEHRRRYEQTVELIRRYAGRYGFDWMLIAAQAYQESRFDQAKRSRAGAVGVMQLLPSTAADPVVGIPDISTAEKNIHAGVKYLRWLREQYFSSEEIDPLDQVLFSFAAYNAGPANVARARRRAEQLGFDPDRWFGHVEVGMYRAVSGEPAAYVKNIYKYYVTYRGLEESRRRQEQARGSAD